MTQTLEKISGADLDDLADLAFEQFVFDDADWRFYELILRKVGERRVFVTFDGERLEVMTPSPEHEKNTSRLEQVVRLLMLEFRVPFESLGSFTLKKRKADAGLEPDRCFYTRNADAIVGKRRIDLSRLPPPDLAIEVEVSRRLLDRLDIYRRLRVPEVWCYDGRRLRILRLSRRGYEEVARSPTLPQVPPDEIHRLMQASWTVNELAWTEMVQQWVRQHIRTSKSI